MKDISFPLLVILGLMGYQLALCYANTHGFPINNTIVAAAESAFLALAALSVAKKIDVAVLAAPMLVLAYFIILWLVRGEVEPQGVRNLAIIFIMYQLGRQTPDPNATNRVMLIASAVVLVFGVWEYAFINSYLSLFDIKSYYTARGMVTQEQLSYLNSNLFISGLRPSGRSILPFLGDQRVSSVFLEPVSMGNYAVIVAMWALSFDADKWKQSLPHFLFAAIFIVAADSRFASLIILLLVIVRAAPTLQKTFWLYPLPVVVTAGLAYFAHLHLVDWQMDDLAGRLAKTGMALLDMPLSVLMGIECRDEYFDMGIPFALSIFGIFACVLLWSALLKLHFRTHQGKRFRATLPIYCLGLLTISGTSFFSAKTAGLLWFALGSLSVARSGAAKQPAENDKAALYVHGQSARGK